VLKTDILGRVRSTVQQREAVLREFERSGLSGTKFAAVAGVNYQTFAVWRRKQKAAPKSRALQAGPSGRTGGMQRRTAVQWVEAVADPRAEGSSSESGVLRVRLGREVELEIARMEQVALAAAFVRALERGPAAC
jgi:hypothetical protein